MGAGWWLSDKRDALQGSPQEGSWSRLETAQSIRQALMPIA